MPSWITIALTVGGMGAIIEYVRRTGRRGGAGLIIAAALHGLAFLVPVPKGPVPHQEEALVDFETASFPPPPVPEALPEPEPEALPAPQPKQRPPRRRAKTKPKAAAPAATPQAQPEASPAPLRFDVSQTAAAGDSGVVVATGTPSAPRGPIGTSKGTGSGRGKGTETSSPALAAPANGPSWTPLSKASLDVLPLPLNVPKIVCPATASDGITGTVTLKVQVRANGRVRRVRVVKRLGSGCDEVARKALLRAKFKPAKRLGGGSADFEIDYEYVFSSR